MKDTEYAFANARIRANERHLLTNSDIERLVDAANYNEAIRILNEKKWSDDGDSDINEIISKQNKKLWDLLNESVPDKGEILVLTVQNDFFNIKAALKCMLTSEPAENYYVYPTSLDLDMLTFSMKNHDFSHMGKFEKSTEEAYKTACKTENGQMADIIIDKATIEHISESMSDSSCELLKNITELICAAADIKIAIRCARTGKSLDFAQSAIGKCRTLDAEKLASLSVKGEDEVFAYLETTDYAKGAELLKESTTAFEKWCDDRIIEIAKGAKLKAFGFEPICAFYYAKQIEIKTVRIILTAKINNISNDIIRERVRSLYV